MRADDDDEHPRHRRLVRSLAERELHADEDAVAMLAHALGYPAAQAPQAADPGVDGCDRKGPATFPRPTRE